MFSDILKEIKTTEDLMAAKEVVDILEREMFRVDGNYQQLEESAARNSLKNEIINGFEKSTDKRIWVKDMRDFWSTMTVVHLVVPNEPSAYIYEQVSKWIKENLGEGYVWEWKIDRRLIGGAVIACKGKYFDGSLIKRLDTYWREGKHV